MGDRVRQPADVAQVGVRDEHRVDPVDHRAQRLELRLVEPLGPAAVEQEGEVVDLEGYDDGADGSGRAFVEGEGDGDALHHAGAHRGVHLSRAAQIARNRKRR